MKTIRCKCCGKIVPSDPRVKHQLYCSEPECQRERKRLWQRHKLKTDPDYRVNQMDCRQRWKEKHPDYWRNWRQTYDAYVQKNRQNSRLRRQFAKMDSLKPKKDSISGSYYLISGDVDVSMFAKMDSLPQYSILFHVVNHLCVGLQNRTRSTGSIFFDKVAPKMEAAMIQKTILIISDYFGFWGGEYLRDYPVLSECVAIHNIPI